MNVQRIRTICDEIKNERRGGAPHELWLQRNREILMMQVRNTTDTRAKATLMQKAHHLFDLFFPFEPAYALARTVGAFLLVVGTVLGGGIASAGVYNAALPGDRLYAVKVGVEKVELALAPNQDYRTRLHADFADRRMGEASAISEGAVARYRYLPDVLASFEGEVRALDSGIESLRSSDRAGAVALAKNVERRLAAYRSAMRKAASVLPGSYRRSLDSTRNLVDSVSIKAMAVIVEHHRAGDEEAPQAVVATNLEEHLNQAEAKIYVAADKEPSAKATAAKAAIAAAKELVTEGKYEAALSKMAEVAELTKEAEADEPVTPPATVAPSVTPADAGVPSP